MRRLRRRRARRRRAVRACRGRGRAGRAAHADGRRAGGDRRRPAHPPRRPRPRGRARRAGRRPLRAGARAPRTSASCATATTWSPSLDVPAPLAALGTTRRGADARRRDRRGRAPGRHAAGRDARRCAAPGCRRCARGRRGDLRVVVNVVIPRRLNREQRELLERPRRTRSPTDEPALRRGRVREASSGAAAGGDPARRPRRAREHAEVVLAELLELAPERGGGGRRGRRRRRVRDLRRARRAAGTAGAGGGRGRRARRGRRPSEVRDDWAERWKQFHRAGARRAIGCACGRRGSSRVGAAASRSRHRPRPGVRHRRARRPRGCASSCCSSWRAARGSLADLGCGSGVLAIAAAKLGWAPVRAVDFEAASVRGDARQRRAPTASRSRSRRCDLRRDPSRGAPTVARQPPAPAAARAAPRG